MTIQIGGLFPGELQPDVTLAGCIDIFYNVWPNPEQTIELIENECANPYSGINWTRATTMNINSNDQRTNFNLGITATAKEYNSIVSQNIHNQMYLLILAASIPYAQKHGIHKLYDDEGYNLLRYSSGQEYKTHYDGSTESGRSISAIVYLNNNYSGGEIEFTNFNIKIKPEPGMLLLFPSNYAYSHIAHPVIDGTKYAIVTWLRDRQL